MIRTFRYVLLALLAITLLTVALANRAPVVLAALPPDMGLVTGFTFAVELPLFIVIFASIIAGVLIGFVWEWSREHKHRVTARSGTRTVTKLERELAALRATNAQPQDDVLALLQDTGPRR